MTQEAHPSLRGAPLSLWQRALADHLAGRLSEAQASYSQLLAHEPAHADALHMLGVLLFQRRQMVPALEHLDAAIAINNRAASFHGHRGQILAAMQRPREAIEAYHAALALNHDMSDVHNNLGVLLQAAGDVPGAIHAYRRALSLQPDMAEATINLGQALKLDRQYAQAVAVLEAMAALRPADSGVARPLAAAHNDYGTSLDLQGNFQDAKSAFQRALAINPEFPEAHFNLGKSLAALNRFEEAIHEYRQALALRPDFPEAHNNLGIALFTRGMPDQAILSYQEALRLRPTYTQALNNLGNALRITGHVDEALRTYRLALRIAPDDHELWNNLGGALDAHGDLEDALAAFDKAIDLRPSFSQAHNNRGNTLKNLGNLDAALAAYQRALELDPANQEVHSNYLYTLYFHPAISLERIHAEHQRWNIAHAAKYRLAPSRFSVHGSPHRRLRIGYVAPTFREHCQSFFTVPLFSQHDRAQFEIIAYSDSTTQDAVTRRLRGHCDGWRNIAGFSDEAVTELIQHDQVDILVDLSLHMSHNRLMVFARKPAPLQVTWLGYPGTTGLETIDYRLSDPYLDPPGGENDACHCEKTWRLPHTFWCYDPLTSDLPASGLPAEKNGYITFGCLNNFCKVNDGVLRLWSMVLREVEHSRLLLLAPRAAHGRVLEAFQRHGIHSHRIEFAERASRLRYLALYHRIDIGLDTFPYNGHTTTLDAFWMGVPVVSLVGAAPVGRAGWSQWNNLGLPQFAAASEQGFVQSAANLSAQMDELKNLRMSLRDRLIRSPLGDAKAFARDIEQAYRHFHDTRMDA